MAELGVVASAVGMASFGIQLADSVLKLKDFWDRVKEAPDEIKHILEEIETLSLVLSEIGQSSDNEDLIKFAPASTVKCLELCRRGTNILGGVVADLELAIGKRKTVGSVKAALKKGTVERLRERLKSAQFMLMLSNQVYSEALQKQRHELQKRWAELQQQSAQEMSRNISLSKDVVLSIRLDQVTTSRSAKIGGEPSPVSDESPSDHAPLPQAEVVQTALKENFQKIKFAKTRRTQLMTRFQIPKWLFFNNRAAEIRAHKSPAGWNFSIQTYNIIPSDSAVFGLAGRGDVTGIQELFSNGGASPFDRDENGLTLLDVAAFNHQLEVCRLLQNEGADPNISQHRSALSMACQSGYKDDEMLFSVLRLLSQEVELEDPFEFDGEDGGFFNFRGSAEVFSWLLQESESTYRQRTLEECVKFAIRLCGVAFQPDMASLVRTIIDGRPISPAMCNIQDSLQKTLLHCAAWSLGEHCGDSYLLTIDEEKVTLTRDLDPSWDYGIRTSNVIKLIRDLIEGGSGVHWLAQSGHRGRQFRTPLLEVFAGYFYYSEFSLKDCRDIMEEHTTSQAMRNLKSLSAFVWLKQLQLSGVDLVEYGRQEMSIHLENEVNREFEYPSWQKYLGDQIEVIKREQLISFTYGPEPEDWGFWFAMAMDDSFTEFWDMIEHPERRVPGAWDDGYDEY